MEAGRCKSLWFQSFFVIWRQQQGWNQRESPARNRFWYPMNTGVSPMDTAPDSSTQWIPAHFQWIPAQRGSSRRIARIPRRDLFIIIPPILLSSSKPKPSAGSIFFGADGVGQREFWIIIRTWFQCPTTLAYPLVSFHTTSYEDGGRMMWMLLVSKILWDSNKFDAMEDMFHIQVEDELFGEDWLKCFTTEILDSKYERTDVVKVVKELIHLNAHQKADLLQVLQENNKMFNGTLGFYPHKKLHIDIDPDAKPVHSRPYPVPWIHLKTFKTELDHLVRIGVLASQQDSEWASPSFIIPPKDGRVRWISDLRQLNKVIRRNQYPLPIITDILSKHSGYKFFTKLDVSMQNYMFELDK